MARPSLIFKAKFLCAGLAWSVSHPGVDMITFNVVREDRGWTVQMGERMTTPFRSRDLAIREAACLADSIRCHGECAEVIVEGNEPGSPPTRHLGSGTTRVDALSRGLL